MGTFVNPCNPFFTENGSAEVHDLRGMDTLATESEIFSLPCDMPSHAISAFPCLLYVSCYSMHTKGV